MDFLLSNLANRWVLSVDFTKHIVVIRRCIYCWESAREEKGAWVTANEWMSGKEEVGGAES